MTPLKATWLVLTGCILTSLPVASQVGKAPTRAGQAGGASTEQASQPSPPEGSVFYVANGGDDSWSGRLPAPNGQRTDGPFRSIPAARDAIRRLKSQAALTQPITVYVRGGVYELPATLVFTAEDSGSEKCPITYAAYASEVPVLSGGRAITGWEPARLNGHEQLWRVVIPTVKEGKWYFHELFVNGQRRERARSPNSGFFHVVGGLTETNNATFKFRDGDLRSTWGGDDSPELMLLQAWTVMRPYITHVDEVTRTVTLSGRQVAYGQEHNARYWVENFFEALDGPGEWYLDRRAGVLYYWPKPGEDMRHAAVVAPALEVLVRLQGEIWGSALPGGDAYAVKPVHDVRLRGLTLSYADWSLPPSGYTDVQSAYTLRAALEAAGANSCAVVKCTFKHLGQYAMEFGKSCKDNRIVENEMTDLGAGGVKIGEPKDPNTEEDVTSGNLVSDNRIHDIGVVDPGAAGIWIGESSGNIVSHNEIFDTYYTAISVGWTWGYLPTAAHDNVIEFNHLHDIGRGMMGDEGCIYTLGMQTGTVVRNNLCHDVTRYENSYGGWGIYTDEGSSHILIENNVVYRTQDGGFHQHFGQNNTIRNNIFALGENAQLRRSIEEKGLSFTFEHNIVYGTRGVLLDGEWKDGNYSFDNNLYFLVGDLGGQSVRLGGLTLTDWQKRGFDVHSLIADPLFVDPDKGDFSLKPGSPARKLGFQPIVMSTVGPRQTE